jgi:hypothetical protein
VTGLVEAHVDVIYVGGDTAIRAAQRATTTIPILGDYREYGWVGTGKLACPARRQHDGYQRPCVRTRRQTPGNPDRVSARTSPHGGHASTPAQPGQRSFGNCKMPHAHAALSFRFIGSPAPKRFRQRSTRRRRRVPRR